jgi:hypothetical protein
MRSELGVNPSLQLEQPATDLGDVPLEATVDTDDAGGLPSQTAGATTWTAVGDGQGRYTRGDQCTSKPGQSETHAHECP